MGKDHMNRLSVALLHHPVVDRFGELYTTAITNIDVHDIARSARTFGLSQYYLVTPIEAQRALAHTIKDFWIDGSGKDRNRDRTQAMELIEVRSSLAECIEHERALTGIEPLLIATSAKDCEKKPIDYKAGQGLIKSHESVILIFGTGYGLASSVVEQAHHLLAPIKGSEDYNHLSVRSAVAIVLDRLCGH